MVPPLSPLYFPDVSTVSYTHLTLPTRGRDTDNELETP